MQNGVIRFFTETDWMQLMMKLIDIWYSKYIPSFLTINDKVLKKSPPLVTCIRVFTTSIGKIPTQRNKPAVPPANIVPSGPKSDKKNDKILHAAPCCLIEVY